MIDGRFLGLFLVILAFTGCAEKKAPEKELEVGTGLKAVENQRQFPDTINNYWEFIQDTIYKMEEFHISNEKYALHLKTFSLNDSSITRNLGLIDSKVIIDHSHEMVTELKLSGASKVDLIQIRKINFKRALIPEFYSECNLFSTKLDSVRGNTLFLTTDLAVPDTDNQWRALYSLTVSEGLFENLNIKQLIMLGYNIIAFEYRFLIIAVNKKPR